MKYNLKAWQMAETTNTYCGSSRAVINGPYSDTENLDAGI